MEARFLKEELERLVPGASVFLDSDDLQDMRALLGFVRESACLVLLQSERVLARPWCLLEVYAAIQANVPIVSLNVLGKGYDYAHVSAYLRHLDQGMLERANAGACRLVEPPKRPLLRSAFAGLCSRSTSKSESISSGSGPDAYSSVTRMPGTLRKVRLLCQSLLFAGDLLLPVVW